MKVGYVHISNPCCQFGPETDITDETDQIGPDPDKYDKTDDFTVLGPALGARAAW